MSATNAQQTIVGCLAATAVVSAGSSLAQGNAPSGKLLIGFGFAGAGLATAAMFAPGLASGFALLILTATVVNNGQPLFDLVGGATAAASVHVTPNPSATTTPKRKTATT